jgi:UDP-4-amino-4,6-dideoxy-N-acetyl-beta-L-altrosamine transaminase
VNSVERKSTVRELMSDIKPMVDANILVYAHNQDSPFYSRASSLLAELMTAKGFYVNTLVLQELFAVITDGRKIERPLDPKAALDIINDCTSSKTVDVLSVCESAFFTWLQNFDSSLKRYEIYDAFIAYTMHRNNISRLYTNNTKDFRKFEFIQAINPFANMPRPVAITLQPESPSPIPYGRQSISEQDVAAVCSVLRSDFLTQGPKIPAFEMAVAEYCGAKHAVAVNSATSALHIACLALGLGPEDWLWTSPITFVASANCGLYCGAKVDFVDIDPRTYNMSVSALEAKLAQAEQQGALPKLVIPVHMCGQPCDMQAIHDLARRYGFHVIEDASHAIGGRYRNESIGNCRYSDITVFSFHPVKIITTGEGGMALTNNPVLAEKMVLLRSHGITRDQEKFENRGMKEKGNETDPSTIKPSHLTTFPPSCYYEQIALGFNYRMTDIQAALGLNQLQRLEAFLARRRELAQRYDKLLANLPVLSPWQQPDGVSAWHLYVIRLQPDTGSFTHRQVFDAMREMGIGVNLHYIPVYTQPYYRKLGFKFGELPEAEKYYQKAITLPLFPAMTEEEQDRVVDALKRILSTEHTEGHGR